MADRSNSPAAAASPGDDSIGSLGQETVKLLRAIAAERMRAHDSSADLTDLAADPTSDTATPEPNVHVCTTGWCPICQLVGYVQEHPELVDQVTETVTDAAIQVGRVLRDFLDKTVPPEK